MLGLWGTHPELPGPVSGREPLKQNLQARRECALGHLSGVEAGPVFWINECEFTLCGSGVLLASSEWHLEGQDPK